MKNSSLFKMVFAIGALVIASGFVGCSGSGGRSVVRPAWYDVYGDLCGRGDPYAGCNYYANGDKIIDIEDPYFNCCYELEFDIWLYQDTFGVWQTYAGFAWESSSGILYDDFGVALNKHKNKVGSDIIADKAEAQNALIEKAGGNFAREYKLQADVGMAWARGLNKAMNLRLARSRDTNELSTISKQLTGISFKEGEKLLRNALASNGQTENLTDRFARHIRTDADTSRKMLKKMFNKEYEKYENAQKSDLKKKCLNESFQKKLKTKLKPTPQTEVRKAIFAPEMT